jgi:hypothetical protein
MNPKWRGKIRELHRYQRVTETLDFASCSMD